MNIKSANESKFKVARELNLPIGHWAITSSGPMGIRGLREIGDIDIIVDDQLWDELAKKYGTKQVKDMLKINIPSDVLDINGPASFPKLDGDDPKKSSMDEQIRTADIIDGLPFVSLKHVIYFKQQLGRDKDIKDIKMIEEYLKSKQK